MDRGFTQYNLKILVNPFISNKETDMQILDIHSTEILSSSITFTLIPPRLLIVCANVLSQITDWLIRFSNLSSSLTFTIVLFASWLYSVILKFLKHSMHKQNSVFDQILNAHLGSFNIGAICLHFYFQTYWEKFNVWNIFQPIHLLKWTSCGFAGEFDNIGYGEILLHCC